MSYRGRSSKGCEPCRTRKVKCDESKPACNRCTKAGHECRYRDQADLLFRNQTAFAAQKAESSWRKRSKSHHQPPSESSAFHALTHDNNKLTSKVTPPPGRNPISEGVESSFSLKELPTPPDSGLHHPSIHSSIPTDLRRLAYERFIYDFVIFETPNKPPDAPSDALWDFIPSLYERSSEGSCLAAIVDAVSYANFGNRCNAPQAHELSNECIGKGIKLLQNNLANTQKAPSDDTLCSVYLMGVFENLTSANRRGTFYAHSAGANALLLLRSIEEFYTNPISARLYELVFWQQLIGNLAAAVPPSIPIRNLVDARQYLPNFYGSSSVYVVQLIHNEAKLHAQWHELKYSDDPPSCRTHLRELLQKALDLDAEFQSWESTVPLSWRYQMELNTPENRAKFDVHWRKLILDSRGAPGEIHSYTSLRKCWNYMFYRTSRIFLLRDLIEILNWLFRLPQSPLLENSPQDLPQDSPQSTNTTNLDDVTLRIHHAFATSHLVNLVEKSCSAIIGHFTVPAYGKSSEDIVGMRGYVSLWSLGIVDAVLRAGLVPDSCAPDSPEITTETSPHSTSSLSSNPHLGPSPGVSKRAEADVHPLYTQPQTNVAQHNEFPPLPTTSFAAQAKVTNPPPSEPFLAPPVLHRTPYDPSRKDRHVFDGSPVHPFDCPTNLPTLDVNITKPKRIDVAARREWLNRLLYFLASEVGITKGLVVPVMEGYLDLVTADVNTILGK